VPDFAFDLGPPPPAPVATEAQAVASRCKSCGKALVDPFDVALGSCDECRATQNDALQTRKVEEEVQNKPAIEPPPVFVKPSPAPAKPPTTAPVIPPPSVPIGAPRDGVRTAHRESLPNTRTRVAAVVLAAFVLVGVIGVALYIKRPWVRRPPRVATTAAAPNAKSVDAILEQWKLKHADLAQEGASSKKKFLEEGETELAKDTPEGYRRAEAAFEKALVLDNSSDRALAGWVFAVAFGRGAGLDDPTSKAAESLLVAAEQRSGAPVLYVAHAHLDIVKGAAPNDVQHRAEIGKNSSAPRDKALASLAFGYSQLSRNVQVAEQSFREALEMEPSVKRTYFFQANLAMSQGRYQQATELLTKRLSLDPDQWDATELLAKLLVEFGDLAGAKKRIDEAVVVAPKSPRPRMGQAVFAYQHGSELNRAVEVLSALGADAALTPKERADALGHLAAALRVQGELDRARLAAEQAVELQPDHRPARVQQVLILCDKGVVSQARLVFDALAEDLSSPLRAQLEGRLFFAEGRFQESQSVLTALADKERSQVGALMLAGAAAAKARKDGKAWELCLKRALVADPFSNPLGPLTSYFVRQADLLRPALGAWAALSKSNNEDPNPHLCEGLAAWHSEDALSADRSFARVTAIDPRGSDAHAFRSLIALRRKETGAALIQANRAVGANRQNPLGHLALSLALLASNKPDAAKVAATQANKFGAALLAPRVVMGEVEARQNNKLEARRLLTGVLLADPWYRDAKRSLFRQGL
jgi:tetratricopeptide (TPR) repeat protein